MPELEIQAVVRRASTVAEAQRLMGAARGPRYYLAGGTDLLVKARDGLVPPSFWCDITGLSELRGVRKMGTVIRIGAATPYSEVSAAPLVRRYAPTLVEAIQEIGGAQIKNRGTIGGNLANGSPAADSVPPLFSLGGVAHTRLNGKARAIPVDRLSTGPGKTVLRPGELITAVEFEARPGVRGRFLRLGQRLANAISKVSVAVSLTFQGGKVSWVGVALGAVGPTVIRAGETEKRLLGRALTRDVIAEAAGAVQREARPIDDVRSTAGYRRRMCGVLLMRILTDLSDAS